MGETKKLKYEGKPFTCGIGSFGSDWEGEKTEAEAEILLRVPGMSEVKENPKPERRRRTRGND